MLGLITDASQKRGNLAELIGRARGTTRELEAGLLELLRSAMETDRPLGDVVGAIAQAERVEENFAAHRYWARTICEVIVDYRDRAGVVAVLRTEDLSPSHAAARKALRRIDFCEFGPELGRVA